MVAHIVCNMHFLMRNFKRCHFSSFSLHKEETADALLGLPRSPGLCVREDETHHAIVGWGFPIKHTHTHTHTYYPTPTAAPLLSWSAYKRTTTRRCQAPSCFIIIFFSEISAAGFLRLNGNERFCFRSFRGPHCLRASGWPPRCTGEASTEMYHRRNSDREPIPINDVFNSGFWFV